MKSTINSAARDDGPEGREADRRERVIATITEVLSEERQRALDRLSVRRDAGLAREA